MARKPKKAAPQPETKSSAAYDELLDDSDLGDEDVPSVDVPSGSATRSRDWRDVERLKEERRLRALIDDDLDFDDRPLRRA